jgi:hypothetical protein
VPKNSLDFQVPKFWQSISQDIEIIDEELEEEGDETTTQHEPYPFFEEEQTHTNETTQLGNDVYLHCRVQNLGEKTVSIHIYERRARAFSLLFHCEQTREGKREKNNTQIFPLCSFITQVSWVRRRGDQLHLITFAESTYSSDSRYSLKFKPPNDWQLHIQYANERDEGQLECQINTKPTLVFVVYLTVVGE